MLPFAGQRGFAAHQFIWLVPSANDGFVQRLFHQFWGDLTGLFVIDQIHNRFSDNRPSRVFLPPAQDTAPESIR